jgi:hypothetical protein
LFKILISLALALGIAGVAYAAAASLTVNGGVAQYGEDIDLVCDADGVQIGKTTVASDNPQLDSVSILGLSNSCDSYNIRVGLTGTFGTLEIYNGSVSAARCGACGGNVRFGSSYTAPLVGLPTITDLTDVHITIY